MPYTLKRRYRNSYKRSLTKRYGSPKKVLPAVRTLQAAVRRTVTRQLNSKIETKQSNRLITNGIEVQHNNFVNISSAMIGTTQGVEDPANGNQNCRIGDEIQLRGVSIRGMVELNSRYSDVYVRVIAVKSAKGDTPTYSTLFQNVCENKMLDRFNTERYTILASKIIKLKAPNAGTTVSTNPVDGSGIATGPPNTLTRSTKIYKMWIPGTKFTKTGKVRYENGSTQPKFFDYHLLMFAFANESVSSLPGTPWNVCSNQDTVITMYYKDA